MEQADPSAPLDPGTQSLKASDLLFLSDLVSTEMDDVLVWWEKVPALRRGEIVSRLVEIAEENADLDFHTFFCYCVNDPDLTIRKEAIGGLWESEDRSIIALLVDRLANDDHADVRAAAALGLGQFALLAQQGKLLPRDGARVWQALREALCKGDEQLAVRRRALESTGALLFEEVSEWVMWGYQSEDTDLRQSALCAMGRSCDSSWLPLILREMHNGDPAMRYEAANACREMGDDEAVPHLATLVDDDDLQVQLAAIQALGSIGGAHAKKLLRLYAHSTMSDDSIREAAEVALEMTELEEAPIHFRMGH